MRTRWPWQWTVAGVVALVVFSAHATVCFWLPTVLRRLVGEVPDLAQAPPAMILLIGGYLVVSWLGGAQIANWIGDGQLTRDRARWAQEQDTRRQLWAMEQQIREEHLSAEERARRQQARQREAAIRREASRRSGLPEEELDENGLL